MSSCMGWLSGIDWPKRERLGSYGGIEVYSDPSVADDEIRFEGPEGVMLISRFPDEGVVEFVTTQRREGSKE